MPDPRETDDILHRLDNVMQIPARMTSAAYDTLIATILFANGMMRSYQDFLSPFLIAANSFGKKEQKTLPQLSLEENLKDYLALFRFNMQIAEGGGAHLSHANESVLQERAHAVHSRFGQDSLGLYG